MSGTHDDAALMTSYRVTTFGRALERMVEPVPRPAGTHVLLRVVASGVCHSDLHIAGGSFDLGRGRRLDLSAVDLPRTLGHEIAGEVIAAGPEAEVELGARRLVYPWIGCGTCALCRAGEEHLCARPQSLGFARDGGFADYVLVPHPRYLLDYGTLAPEVAATYACAGLTAFGALRKVTPPSAENPLLIVGAGGVGESAIRLAARLHAHPPVVADVAAPKRANALAAGASAAFDPADATARRGARGDGFAAVIDFVGSESSIELALAMVRKGGTVVVVGLYGGLLELALPLIPLRALTLRGSYVGSLDELRELLALAQTDAPQVHVVTRPLAGAQQALDALRDGTVIGRSVLVPAPPAGRVR